MIVTGGQKRGSIQLGHGQVSYSHVDVTRNALSPAAASKAFELHDHALRKLQPRFLVRVKYLSLIVDILTQNRLRCVSVGTRKGYSITNCDPFGRVYTMSMFRDLD